MLEAYIERFPNETTVEEIVTKDRISAKIKTILTNFRKAVNSGKNKLVVGVLFLHYIAYAKVYGEVAQQLILFRILLIHRMILRRHLIQPLHISHQLLLMK